MIFTEFRETFPQKLFGPHPFPFFV
jgi:hypothetical protein